MVDLATSDEIPHPRNGRGRALIYHVVLCLASIAMLYPLLWMLASSFKPDSDIFGDASLWPRHFSLDAYWRGWSGLQVTFGRFFLNSLVVSLCSVVGNVMSCSLAAYAFARLRFRLSGPLFAFALVTIMLPAHVTLIPQYVVFQQLGMIDTFVPLILPKLLATDAFFVFLMVQFMRGIPYELDEAAKIDGCGPIRNYRYVVLPLSRPAMVTTAIFTFIWTWNDFFSQLIYLSSTENYTIPMGLRLFIDQTSSSSYGPMFAMSVLSLVPIGLFFLAFQRLLVEGAATSGLKG